MAPTRWKLLFALNALLLASSACSDDTTKDKPDSGNPGGDGDGDGDGDSNIPPLPENTAGKACTGDAECSPGTCAANLTAGAIGSAFGFSVETAGGYCTAGCQQDTECGVSGECFGAIPAEIPSFLLQQVGIESSKGECRQACSAEAPCREGYECAATNQEVLIALGPLAPLIELPSTCQPLPPTDQLTDQVGKTCATDGDCGVGTCIPGVIGGGDAGFDPIENDVYPGGYCTGNCTADEHCGTDGVCIVGFYGSAGTCNEGCATTADCARAAEGYTCQDGGGGKMVCRGEVQQMPQPNLPDGGEPEPDAGQPEPDAGQPVDPGSNDGG